jgi:uncharacterized membrane protein YqjE
LSDARTASPDAAGQRRHPVLDSLRPWVALLQVRLQLLALEVEEESLRLKHILAWGAVATVCLSMAAVCGAVLLAVLFWEEHRVAVLLSLCTLFVGMGAVAVWCVVRLVQQGSQLFAASLAELQRDQDRLQRPPGNSR